MDMYEFAKKEFEKQYDSKMTVQVNELHKDGPITKDEWVDKIVDQPCRIAQKRVVNPASNAEVAQVVYITTLYCDCNVEVPPGSRLYITDCHEVTRRYKRSSEGFSSYRTHQEIEVSRELKA